MCRLLPCVQVTNPIETFRGALNRRRDETLASLPAFRAKLRDRKATYGGRDLVKTIRPKFLSRGDLRYLDYVCSVLSGACRRIADRVLEDKGVQAFIGLTEGELRLCLPRPLCPDPMAFARFDAFDTPNGFQFVELNGEVPAGPGYGDVITETFLEHPLIEEIVRLTGASTVPTSPPVLDHLLMAWRAAGKSRKPTILVTDYLDVATLSEFQILVERWSMAGYTCVLEDPRNLTRQNGRLVAKGVPVDVVYRRLLVNEYLERENEVRNLGDASAAGEVVMVNPFRSKLLHKKVTFALLHGDAIGTDWLSHEERRVIKATVPWTRKVQDAKVPDPDGRMVDLLPWAVAHRSQLVLKPSDEYGGRGVTLGWVGTESEFESALKTALSGDWVLQHRVSPLEEPFPLMDDGLTEHTMTVDIDPYLHFGRVHGVLARLAAGAISNVTSGGGQVPVLFLPED